MGSGAAGPQARDLAYRILAAATARMASGRRDWGTAMLAELDQIHRRAERWRFALGAARVALFPLRAAGPSGRRRVAVPVIRLAMVSCIAASVTLTTYAVWRYPQPVSSNVHPYLLLCPLLAALLAGYARLALWLRQQPEDTAARYGLAAASFMAASWTAGFLLHEQLGLTATGWAWPVAFAAPLAAGAAAARRQGNIGEGAIAGLWAGLFGGLGLFIVTMTTTFGSGSWYAHDQQTIADAHLHGQSAAVWIVGDSLGGSIFMLIFIPVLSIILSALGAAAVQLGQTLHWPRRPKSLTGFVS